MKTHKLSVLALACAFASALKPTVLYVREGEGGGAAGGGDGAGAGKTVEQLVQEGVDAAVKGLKAKNDELLGKNKDFQTRLAAFGTIDPVRAASLIEQLDHDEDLKLFSEGKKAMVIEKYTDRMRTAHSTELEAERLLTLAERQRGDNYRGAVLDNHIRSVTTDLHKGAVEDALLHARQIFSLDAKGNAVKLDAEGRPELGKDGKSLFGPAEWMEMQRELKPHWFPASTSGSGSTGAQGSGSGTGKTMKRGEFDVLTPMQKANVARSGTRIID
jgi:hypothetical protein